MRLCKFLPLTIVLFACLTMTIACGSGSGGGSQTQPSTPIFTSSPVTTATQDVAYSYQLAATDPAGGSVTFTLTTSPSGAALSGSTVSWTPTAAESRVSNSFSVTAKTASGGTAVQSWSVTPGGTITVNWVNTYWTADGASQVPEVSSGASNLSAMWTNPDGSITVQKGSWSSAGVFVIPNVPAGFYWLQTSGLSMRAEGLLEVHYPRLRIQRKRRFYSTSRGLRASRHSRLSILRERFREVLGLSYWIIRARLPSRTRR